MITLYRRRWCLLILLVAVFIDEAEAQQPGAAAPAPGVSMSRETGGITGRVQLPSGNNVSTWVKVTLRIAQQPLMTITADKNGEFRFTNLRNGVYWVEVVGDSKLYETVTEEVEINRNRTINLTITLRDRKDAAASKPPAGVVSVAELEQNVPARARKEYEKGTKLIGNGDVVPGLEHIRQAIIIYPDYLAARNELGSQYLKQKRLQEAVEQFEATIKLVPQAFAPRLNIGIVLVEQKKYREALEHLNRAVSIDASQPAAHLYRGVASLGVDELTGAFEELSKALILGGDQYAVAHYYIAFVRIKRGEKPEAAGELQAYLKAAPDGELAEHAKTLLASLK